MGKGKKQREKAKRLAKLNKLRGIDSAGNALSPNGSRKQQDSGLLPKSPTPSAGTGAAAASSSSSLSTSPKRSLLDALRTVNGDSKHNAGHGLAHKRKRKRIDFVLPRKLGSKTEDYIFHKHGKPMLNEILAPIDEHSDEDNDSEDSTAAEKHRERKQMLKSQSIDDILNGPSRSSKITNAQQQKQQQQSKQKQKQKQREKQLSPRKENGADNGKARKAPSEQAKDQAMNDANGNVSPKLPKSPKNSRNSNNPEVAANGERIKNHSDQADAQSADNAPQQTPPKKKRKKTKKATDSPVKDGQQSHGPPVTSLEAQLSGRSVEDAVRDKVGLRPRANSTDGELNLPQRGLCDERMALAAHKWPVGSNFTGKAMPKGFHNLGNTCFLNSTLQCLAYLPPFCQSLITIAETKLGERSGMSTDKLTPGQKITKILCRLFQNVHGFNNKYAGQHAIAPEGIVRSLPNLTRCGSRTGYKFRPGRQEDAHEFLIHLLDAMHDGELRGAGINQHKSGWRDRLPVPRLDETTFIHRIFGGYLRSQVKCTDCGYCSNTYDPFLDLSLEVSKKSSSSLSRAYIEFTRRETLDSENRWKCSGCKKRVCASKQLTVFRPPLALCVQLKRFSFGGGFGLGMSPFSMGGGGGWKYGKHGFKGRGGGGKISKPIEFPANLNLPMSDKRSCAYALTGIVIHVGGSASSGHYTAYIKKPGKNGSSQWYHVDDSYVEPVSEKTVLRQRDAYLLFYSRKEVKLELPSPPPRSSMSAEEAKRVGKVRARARANSLTSEGDEMNVAGLDVAHPALAEKSNPAGGKKAPVLPSAKDDAKAKTLMEKQSPQKQKQTRTESRTNASSDSNSDSSDEASDATSESSSSDVDSVEKVFPKMSAGNTAELSQTSDRNSKGNKAQKGMKEKSKRHDTQAEGKSQSVPETASKAISRNDGVSGSGSGSDSTSGSSSSSDSDDSSSSGSSSSSDSNSSSSNDSTDKKTNAAVNGNVADKSMNDEQQAIISLKKIVEKDNQGEVASSTSSQQARTKIVLNQKSSREKIQVMIGPRRNKKIWKTKATSHRKRGKGYELLGNLGVSRWDDDDDAAGTKDSDDSSSRTNGNASTTATAKRKMVHGIQSRDKIIAKIAKQDKSRKRDMQLDRWDSVLDQGKQKKVKMKQDLGDFPRNPAGGKQANRFERIQQGIMSFGRGRQKGYNGGSKSPQNRKRHKGNKGKMRR